MKAWFFLKMLEKIYLTFWDFISVFTTKVGRKGCVLLLDVSMLFSYGAAYPSQLVKLWSMERMFLEALDRRKKWTQQNNFLHSSSRFDKSIWNSSDVASCSYYLKNLKLYDLGNRSVCASYIFQVYAACPNFFKTSRFSRTNELSNTMLSVLINDAIKLECWTFSANVLEMRLTSLLELSRDQFSVVFLKKMLKSLVLSRL